MCDDYDEVPSFSYETWRKARKPHHCITCGEGIRPGDRYMHAAQKFDGILSTFSQCARCHLVCKALFAAGARSLDWELECESDWAEAVACGDLKGPEPGHLAFLTPDEAQAMLAKESSP